MSDARGRVVSCPAGIYESEPELQEREKNPFNHGELIGKGKFLPLDGHRFTIGFTQWAPAGRDVNTLKMLRMSLRTNKNLSKAAIERFNKNEIVYRERLAEMPLPTTYIDLGPYGEVRIDEAPDEAFLDRDAGFREVAKINRLTVAKFGKRCKGVDVWWAVLLEVGKSPAGSSIRWISIGEGETIGGMGVAVERPVRHVAPTSDELSKYLIPWGRLKRRRRN